MKLASLWHRIYADFFMPGRLDTYRALLAEALDRGYHICSVASFWAETKNGRREHTKKYLVLRHDVDTDPGCAAEMWKIERSLGVASSYYFRLSTVDVSLMQQMERSGGEASYHYEELATVAKQRRLKTPERVLHHLPYIREEFKKNLTWLRQETGIPMKIVAAHGDFVNAKLQISNVVILRDPAFREEVGVELEAYDEELMKHVETRYSDTPYPDFWKTESPRNAIKAGQRVVLVLFHPRHWRANLKANLNFEVTRIIEGLRYGL